MMNWRYCLLAIFLFLFIIGCSKETPITGTVGQKITLTPTIKSPDDTLNCQFRWTFSSKPLESNMDVLSFLPNSRTFSVSFFPDVVGDYKVQFTILGPDGREKFRQTFTCKISEPAPGEAPPPIVKAPTETSQVETSEKQVPPPTIKPQTPLQTPKPAKPKPQIAAKIPKVKGKYTIQISAWKSLDKAELAKRKLAEANIDAYIQKVYFKETNETWYRVRTGNFDSYQEAKKAFEELQKQFPKEKLWIDYVRKD